MKLKAYSIKYTQKFQEYLEVGTCRGWKTGVVLFVKYAIAFSILQKRGDLPFYKMYTCQGCI